MATTLAQLRAMVREEIGDEERLTGTATGGSATEVIDSSRLTQADNAWQNQRIFIKDTTDDLAPKGEARRIVSSSSSATKVIVGLPFSVTVAAGDTYGIAVFSDGMIDRAINGALATFSEFVPYRTTETMTVTPGKSRFAPTSADTLSHITKIEYYNEADQEEIDYSGQWRWDSNLKKVVFDYFWTETKALTLYLTKPHPTLSSDNDNVTVEAVHINYVVRLAAASLLLSLSQRDFKTDFGSIRPRSITRGPISETYGDVMEQVAGTRTELLRELQALVTQPFVGVAAVSGNGPSDSIPINRHEEPGWVPPPVFWELGR